MSCDACEEAWEIDGEIPECKTGKGCAIPPLDEAGTCIMEIRDRLVRLGDLVGKENILKMYRLTVEDLELLAAMEDLFAKAGNARSEGTQETNG